MVLADSQYLPPWDAFLPDLLNATRDHLVLENPLEKPSITQDDVLNTAQQAFLDNDIQLSLPPSIPTPVDLLVKNTGEISGPLFLQIVDIQDTTYSKLDLVKSISPTPYRSTPFSILNKFMTLQIQFPRGSLYLELTDGYTTIPALEWHAKFENEISLMTPMGSKLCLANVKIRRGTLLLTRESTVVLLRESDPAYLLSRNRVNPLDRLLLELGYPPCEQEPRAVYEDEEHVEIVQPVGFNGQAPTVPMITPADTVPNSAVTKQDETFQ